MGSESFKSGTFKIKSERNTMMAIKQFQKMTCMLLMGFLMMPVFSLSVYASYEERVKVEDQFSNRAQRILDNMYGDNNFAVTAKIKMSKESYSIKYVSRAKIKGEKKKQDKGTKYQILPGFSAIKNLAPDMDSSPFNSVVTWNDPKILNIQLDIVVGNHISKREGRDIQQLLTKVLNLNSKRGDKVNLIYQKFPYMESILASAMDQEVISPKAPTSHKFLLVLAIIFLIAYIYLQLKFLKKTDTASDSGGGSGAPPSTGGDKPDLSMPKAPSQQSASMKHYFDFIDDSNVSAVVQILMAEKVPEKHVSTLLSFLPGSVAADIISSYPADVQTQLLGGLVDQKVVDKTTLEGLEKKIKSKLECSVGGSSFISQVFEFLPGANKKTILKGMEKNPAVYQKVRKHVVLFDDIQYLSNDEIKRVIAEMDLNVLSLSMLKVDPKTKSKLSSNMSPAALAMVKQFEDLKGKSSTDYEIDSAQNNVVGLLTRMEKDRLIDLSSKVPGMKSK